MRKFQRVQTMETKYTKDTLQAFKKKISKKISSEKLWVDTKTECGGAIMKYCKEKQPNAAYAEKAINFLRLIKNCIDAYYELTAQNLCFLSSW